MQVQFQAVGKKAESLRKLITEDLHDRPHEVLYVMQFKNPDRPSGWAKVRGRGLRGAVNIRWDSSSRLLSVRVIAKQGHSPHELLGVFLAYLVERHGRRISSINIQLR